MGWMRGHLARVAAFWLAIQLGVFVAAPTSLCATTSVATVGAECTCDHGDGLACPMHHSSSKPNAQDSDCSCRGTDDPLFAVVASLIGPSAVLAAASVAAAPVAVTNPAPIASADPLDSAFVPDPRPPRA